VDHDCVNRFAERAGRKFPLSRMEGIVEVGLHEHAAHDVGHKHPGAVSRQVDAAASPGRTLGEVCGAQEPVLARGEAQRLSLVPDMVPSGDSIVTGIDRVPEYLLGNAEAAGGVLAIDDDEIEPVVGNQAGKALTNGRSPRAAHHVAQKEKSHSPSYRVA